MAFDAENRLLKKMDSLFVLFEKGLSLRFFEVCCKDFESFFMEWIGIEVGPLNLFGFSVGYKSCLVEKDCKLLIEIWELEFFAKLELLF